MSLAWPFALAALLAVPLLALVWLVMRRRRRRAAVRVSSLRLARAANGPSSRARTWVPAALLGVGMLLAGVAVARPQTTVDVATSESTMMLAIDVSSSMCTTDVDPNRLIAAQEAAVEFIEAQPEGTRIGIVAFSSIAGVVASPTSDKDDLIAAVDSLTTSRGTAIGQAILASIDAIASIDPDVAPTGVEVEATSTSADQEDDAGYAAETIVVLTDGSNSTGVEPVTAAEEAAARGLRVYTIGFGTTESASSSCSAGQVDTSQLMGGGGGGGQTIDVATLQEVADLTGGEYFAADAADSLTEVLLDLPEVVDVQQEKVDVGNWFVLGAAGSAATGVALSLWWGRTRRPQRAATTP
ncbi:VWA domain-containing protein [Demequina lignilytica]|uniref:VWA domain-containing protein n=1 Tax=Demequina lignilytica TaxID=3051663 RepID=A0AB35MDX6_9MICO|nr:VWA domain-containing protein [Demequina sp. SYSU T0a273]MDN4481960.1 VWA domain-containing protein [Demequina sp. SYSU T0a273]